ncbi:hypothetical protein IEQ34_007807 [Dendrobium chrysotoxum]|uniref:Uncharacterized protein n=1 Tax=Dendrobium chrysotoxum TaxID=161865 RepID=A0AAV7H4V0_DENCH|nr:hypothetical protein IEQ34_007807 [Dendrobium chrysotoxum]
MAPVLYEITAADLAAANQLLALSGVGGGDGGGGDDSDSNGSEFILRSMGSTESLEGRRRRRRLRKYRRICDVYLTAAVVSGGDQSDFRWGREMIY